MIKPLVNLFADTRYAKLGSELRAAHREKLSQVRRHRLNRGHTIAEAEREFEVFSDQRLPTRGRYRLGP